MAYEGHDPKIPYSPGEALSYVLQDYAMPEETLHQIRRRRRQRQLEDYADVLGLRGQEAKVAGLEAQTAFTRMVRPWQVFGPLGLRERALDLQRARQEQRHTEFETNIEAQAERQTRAIEAQAENLRRRQEFGTSEREAKQVFATGEREAKQKFQRDRDLLHERVRTGIAFLRQNQPRGGTRGGTAGMDPRAYLQNLNRLVSAARSVSAMSPELAESFQPYLNEAQKYFQQASTQGYQNAIHTGNLAHLTAPGNRAMEYLNQVLDMAGRPTSTTSAMPFAAAGNAARPAIPSVMAFPQEGGGGTITNVPTNPLMQAMMRNRGMGYDYVGGNIPPSAVPPNAGVLAGPLQAVPALGGIPMVRPGTERMEGYPGLPTEHGYVTPPVLAGPTRRPPTLGERAVSAAAEGRRTAERKEEFGREKFERGAQERAAARKETEQERAKREAESARKEKKADLQKAYDEGQRIFMRAQSEKDARGQPIDPDQAQALAQDRFLQVYAQRTGKAFSGTPPVFRGAPRERAKSREERLMEIQQALEGKTTGPAKTKAQIEAEVKALPSIPAPVHKPPGSGAVLAAPGKTETKPQQKPKGKVPNRLFK